MRYELPSLAFRYTAADGDKTTVAPVIRAGGKSVVKAREHAMLKVERPAHVTILSLVRDAAARLPRGVGTRADVCALLRDSQYFVQETPDAQVGAGNGLMCCDAQVARASGCYLHLSLACTAGEQRNHLWVQVCSTHAVITARY